MAIGCEEEEQLIEERELPNGMGLRLYDRSRRVAADRWLVRLAGEARIALAPELEAPLQKEEPEVRAAVRKRLGEALTFMIVKERNFVAGEEKNEVMAALVGQIRENMLDYLSRPGFPQKLLRREAERLKGRYLLEREMDRQAEAAGRDDDPGPADFSLCFRDGRAPARRD